MITYASILRGLERSKRWNRGCRALTPGPMRPPTRSASEGLYRPPATSSEPPTRSAIEGLYRPAAESSKPPTRSVSEGLYQPPAKSNGTPTRSVSEGLYQPDAESSPPPTRSVSVSLTMIVKNEEENLPRCLASVEGVFDEIIVVDTGSTDRTKEIAREFGAKVFDFEWIDSFAAARNEALSHATGDYAFWLDADDVVEPVERVKLLALLGRLSEPRMFPPLMWCAAVRSEPRWQRAAHRRRSHPAVSHSAGRALDVSGARADLAFAQASEIAVRWTD